MSLPLLREAAEADSALQGEAWGACFTAYDRVKKSLQFHQKIESSSCPRLHSPVQPYCNKTGMSISICILCLLLHWFRNHIGKKHDYHLPIPTTTSASGTWGMVCPESAVSRKPGESRLRKEGVIHHQVNRDFSFSLDSKWPNKGVGSQTKVILTKAVSYWHPVTKIHQRERMQRQV